MIQIMKNKIGRGKLYFEYKKPFPNVNKSNFLFYNIIMKPINNLHYYYCETCDKYVQITLKTLHKFQHIVPKDDMISDEED